MLDTNIVSHAVAGRQPFAARLDAFLDGGAHILLCPVVLYEMERGLRANPAATRRRARFDAHLPAFEYRDLDRAVWLETADLWAKCKRAGRPHSDNDLVIAAFAKVHGAVLVTDNRRDFEGLGVKLEDWGER